MTCGNRLRRNFMEHELRCHCCGLFIEHDYFLDRLQALRDRLGVPVYVTSGTRCRKHNVEVGGARNSYHMKGMAGDLRAKGKTLQETARAAKAVGFKGIKLYAKQGFVHCDVRPTSWFVGV